MALRSLKFCFIVYSLLAILAHGESAKSSDDWVHKMRKDSIKQREENKDVIVITKRSSSLGILSVGLGSAVLSGRNSMAWSGELSAHISESEPIYFGLLFVYSQWNISPGQLTALHFLPTLLYRFDASQVIHPYLGVSAGIARISTDDAADSISAGSTGLGLKGPSDSAGQFEFLIRVGADMGGRNGIRFNVEPRFGFLGPQFIFMTQLGLSDAF